MLDLKDMKRWPLFWLSLFFKVVYLGLTLIAPIVIIACKYSLFIKKEQVGKLNGWGLILLIVFVVIGLRGFKKQLAKLPDITIGQQRFKYSLELVYALLFPIIAYFVIIQFKSNFTLAYTTFKWCFWFVIGGIFIDKLFISYIDKEIELRHKAQEQKEINDRIAKI